MNIVNNKYL